MTGRTKAHPGGGRGARAAVPAHRRKQVPRTRFRRWVPSSRSVRKAATAIGFTLAFVAAVYAMLRVGVWIRSGQL